MILQLIISWYQHTAIKLCVFYHVLEYSCHIIRTYYIPTYFFSLLNSVFLYISKHDYLKPHNTYGKNGIIWIFNDDEVYWWYYNYLTTNNTSLILSDVYIFMFDHLRVTKNSNNNSLLSILVVIIKDNNVNI